MNHAELILAHKTPGFEVPECDGRMEPLWARPDRVTNGTETVEHTVVLTYCPKCNRCVSIDETAKQVRNVYQPCHPVALVAVELALTLAEQGQGGDR